MITRGEYWNDNVRKCTRMITRGGYSNDYCNDHEGILL